MLSALLKSLGIILATGTCLAESTTILTTCRQVSDHVDDKSFETFPFVMTAVVAQVVSGTTRYFTVEDDSGFTQIMIATNAATKGVGIEEGHAIVAKGFLETDWAVATCTNIAFLRKSTCPTFKSASLPDVLAGHCDSHIITVKGVVKHIFDDDIDPRFQFIVLECNSTSIYVASERNIIANQHLIGATIEVTGTCNPYGNIYRRHIGRSLGVLSLKVLSPATHDPYDIPDISSIRRLGPPEIASLGRHKMHGLVAATWGDNLALVQTKEKKFVRVEFATSRRPTVGSSIDIIGYPTTDLYKINLTSAYWRDASDTLAIPSAAADISVHNWVRTNANHHCYIPSFNGKLVRATGLVREVSHEPDRLGILTLESEQVRLKVDATANPDILQNVEIGCTVSVTGVAVMDIDNWRPNAAFPKIRGFFVVPRSTDDLTILSRPPWLTPRRLLTALAVLAFVLVAIVIWNRILKSQVERRSKQLLRERTEGIRSKLKADERTRIAVELHDSLSQNLAGVTFELDAACNLTHDRDLMMRHLGIASKALKSCRREMRDCLWDLRNNALGTGSLNEVIHRSLVPIVGQTQVVIRFDALRSRLTDDLIHAILRIVRELVSNAIRHGKATTVRISGCLDGKFVRFSVRDNGIGFGETPPPGTAEGHFGLQGVRERARHFNGDMTISRTPKDETRVAVCLQIPEFDFTD